MYYEPARCVKYLNDFIARSEQNGVPIEAGWEARLDVELNDIVIQGSNTTRVSRKQVSLRFRLRHPHTHTHTVTHPALNHIHARCDHQFMVLECQFARVVCSQMSRLNVLVAEYKCVHTPSNLPRPHRPHPDPIPRIGARRTAVPALLAVLGQRVPAPSARLDRRGGRHARDAAPHAVLPVSVPVRRADRQQSADAAGRRRCDGGRCTGAGSCRRMLRPTERLVQATWILFLKLHHFVVVCMLFILFARRQTQKPLKTSISSNTHHSQK